MCDSKCLGSGEITLWTGQNYERKDIWPRGEIIRGPGTVFKYLECSKSEERLDLFWPVPEDKIEVRGEVTGRQAY